VPSSMGRIPRFRRSGVPRLWVPSNCTGQARGGYEDVQHGDIEPDRGFEWFSRSGGNGDQSCGTERSIRPATAAPRSVVVSDIGDGSLLLEAWRDGPSAYLSSADAVPFKRQLAAPFGSTDLSPSSSQGEAR
jgi:hypothetical protein